MDREGKKSRDRLVARKDVEWLKDENGKATTTAVIHCSNADIPVVWHGYAQLCVCRLCCISDRCFARGNYKEPPPCKRSRDECGYFVPVEDEVEWGHEEPSLGDVFSDILYKDVLAAEDSAAQLCMGRL